MALERLHTIPEVDETDSSEASSRNSSLKLFLRDGSLSHASPNLKDLRRGSLTGVGLWNPGSYSLLDSANGTRSILSPPAFDTYRSHEQGVLRAERVKSIDDVATEKQRQKFKTSTKFYIPRISLSKRSVSKIAMESFSASTEGGIARDFEFHSSALRYAGSTPGSSEESVLRIFIDPVLCLQVA